jgi:hypothetical protein
MATQALSAVVHLLKLYKQEKIVDQANLSSPIISKGIIPMVEMNGVQDQVNVAAGTSGSARAIADGGTLPEGGSITPAYGWINPKALMDRLKLGRINVKVIHKSGKKALVDFVAQQMSMTGKGLGRLRERQVINGGACAAPSAPVAAASSSFTVTDGSGFRPGESFDVYNGSTFIETARCSAVSFTVGTGAATVTLVGTNAFQWETAYSIYTPSGAYSNALTSLVDACAAASLYGISNTAYDWGGNLVSSQGALDAPAVKDMLTAISVRSESEKPKAILAHPLNAQRLYDSMSDGIQYVGSGVMDQYGMSLKVAGVGVFESTNVPIADVFVVPEQGLMLRCWQDFEPEMDDVSPSDTTFDYDWEINGLFNLRVEKRNSIGRIGGITS